MESQTQHNSLLKILILASIVSTLIHNIDNYIRFDHYPQPDWITPGGIVRSWILWTIFGVAGVLLYNRRRFWSSYICLIVYSTCGLSSLAHYLYGSADQFSPFMHIFILTDGIAGAGILGFTIRSALSLQERWGSSPHTS